MSKKFRELKIGDKVRILQDHSYWKKGDITEVVGNTPLYGLTTRNVEQDCPYYLKTDKVIGEDKYFAPFREKYEYIVLENRIGGELL